MQGQRARNRSKAGKEWWGKRPLSSHPVSTRSKKNKFFKKLLHKIERIQGKKEINHDQSINR